LGLIMALPVHEIKRVAAGRWRDILVGLGLPAEALSGKHGPCPGCGGKDRFRFLPDDPNGRWICGQGGATTGGDGFDVLVHCGRGRGQGDAFKSVADWLGLTERPLTPAQRWELALRRRRAEFHKLDKAIFHETHVLQRLVATAMPVGCWKSIEPSVSSAPSGRRCLKNLRSVKCWRCAACKKQ
jgi:phage/plasmid primase-like uncharacterized protein